MANFGVSGSKGATSVQIVLALNAAAANMRRCKIYEATFGCTATPAAQQVGLIGQRTTTLPTGAALTPNAKDPADTQAATTVATATITIDPALTAAAFPFAGMGLNQNNSYRWFDPDRPIIIPAVANAGVGFGFETATTVVWKCGASFEEQ